MGAEAESPRPHRQIPGQKSNSGSGKYTLNHSKHSFFFFFFPYFFFLNILRWHSRLSFPFQRRRLFCLILKYWYYFIRKKKKATDGRKHSTYCLHSLLLLIGKFKKKKNFFFRVHVWLGSTSFLFFSFFLYLDDAAQSTYVVERERGYGKLTLAFISVSFWFHFLFILHAAI